MVDLKAKLEQVGIDTKTLRTLREVAIIGSTVKEEPDITDIEKQFPIYTLETSYKDTFDIWQKLHSYRKEIEHTPVILGEWDSVRMLFEGREFAETPEAYLTLANEFDAREWLDKKYALLYSYDYPHLTEADILGSWKKTAPYNRFDVSMIASDRRKKNNFFIGLMPTLSSWEIAAYLGYGCWNDCPCAEFHIGVQRYWHTLYDTEVVALLFDTMIMRINKPVEDKDTALNFAKDQMVYCNDVILQGYQKLRTLASALINSTYCWFWWD